MAEDVLAQEKVVSRLKIEIQARHNEVIGFNEQLKEQALKQVQEEINRLNNQLFSIQNKTESLNGLQDSGINRMQELRNQLRLTQESISGTRAEALNLLDQVNELREKILLGQEQFNAAESGFNSALAEYNELNLQVIQQQNRISALKQEREFRNKHLIRFKVPA